MSAILSRIIALSDAAPADLEDLMQDIRSRMDSTDLRVGFNRGLLVAAAEFYRLAAVKRLKGKTVEAEFCEEIAVLISGAAVEEPSGCGLPDEFASIGSGEMAMPEEFQHG